MNKTPITTVIKQALAKVYGHNNVSVKKGQGTAASWVTVSVTVNEKQPRCALCTVSVFGRCDACTDKIVNARRQAEHIAYAAIKEAGLKFGTYYEDEGYGERKDQLSLSIRYA